MIIVGAGAAGLMCAIEAGRRGRSVRVLDHANKAGKKILMSGGGRCNFTNREIGADNFISHNPHFCKSALSRYTQWDFIAMVEHHRIPYHERDLGKLFCDRSAKDILRMVLTECETVGATVHLDCSISRVSRIEHPRKDRPHRFRVETPDGDVEADSLVIASGGLSIPKMCASPFGYRVAEQFGHSIQPTSAGLVPFTLHPDDKARLGELAGVSVEATVRAGQMAFDEPVLFTHRGLSGPGILQISSYWHPGEAVAIDLLPGLDLMGLLPARQAEQPNVKLRTVLAGILPKRLVSTLLDGHFLGADIRDTPMRGLSPTRMERLAQQLHNWEIKPSGTEGYRTAEVTLGGVDCSELSSQTMESSRVPGLYFIGEVVDVTGWLGGYNFQWAWSSGWCAGQVV